MSPSTLQAIVHIDEPYTQQCVVRSLESSPLDFKVSTDISQNECEKDYTTPFIHLQWLEYELIDWDHIHRPSTSINSMCNAYCIRKGLIRKSQFAYNVTKYLSKYPESILSQAIPETWQFELDHVDYFEEAMNEVFEVERDLLANEEEEGELKHRFIIKPSLANKAAGIQVFDSLEQLRNIFVMEDSDSEEDDNEEDISQVREWVIQRYIDHPLLVHQRKFHVRAYVLAVGNIQVYLYRDMLALFAMKDYTLENLSDTLIHLTNTCIQTDQADFDEQASVKLFWELEQCGIAKKDLDSIFTKMQLILKDVFDACSSEMTTFQALPNVFELFGVDFMIDQDMNVYFLETNAFPDFKQTGTRLQNVIQELFDATTKTAVEPFFGMIGESDERMIKVFDRQLLSL
ncbi:tubulin-tyrosine ligase family-domain-containing protein [Halteromyces radiatus]|uniref:tubulin-tyrosine ligase family-domain-containing protein n=1 Tax=Halteromyces radiatus TaxID=101107 RepID=UPI00221EB578|nr:tubulin-tyrosine ligase family-domain-containing protein [Halteromyces radiatus]KAI8083162.1 tubulin-tyrosine ligase family-domain-containing protein [Halteromyces radiatus]